MDQTTGQFGLRPLHRWASAALCGGGLWLAAGAAAPHSLWCVPFLGFATVFGWHVHRFGLYRFEVGEERVVHHVPPRRMGASVLSIFRWDDVVRVKGTLGLESPGQVWLWGEAFSVQLTSGYVTLYPEAFGDEALQIFLAAADRRGLLHDCGGAGGRRRPSFNGAGGPRPRTSTP